MSNRYVNLSFTVSYDIELESGACGNCGALTPDPPTERLEYVIKEHYKKNRFLHPDTVLAKNIKMKAGPNQWADWLPEGWTAGQHPKVPLLCPRCTKAIVEALAVAKLATQIELREAAKKAAKLDCICALLDGAVDEDECPQHGFIKP